MYITHISIRDFRNVGGLELEPHAHFNILSGPNGAGKTNILEALYILGNVRSFRYGRNQDLVRIGADTACVGAHFVRGEVRQQAAFEIDGRSKRFFVNTKPSRSFTDYMGTLPVVMFGPADLRLLQGGATQRRRFLDRLVYGARPTHLASLQRYERALKARNQLLKEPVRDAAVMSAYTEQLVSLAAQVIRRRAEVVEAVRSMAAEVFESIFQAGLHLDAAYDVRWSTSPVAPSELVDPERLEARLREALANRRADEYRVGYTLVGPHRDDLRVELAGRPIREYASQGQTRAAVLALKITEIRFFTAENGDGPVLLLDDVSSELDRRRNEQLFDFVREIDSQTFITTTDRRYIQIERDLRSYAVHEGQATLQPTGP